MGMGRSLDRSDWPVTLAMTGASGARYGLRLLEVLLRMEKRVTLLLSDAGRVVLMQECGLDLPKESGAVVEALHRHLRSAAGRALDGRLALRHYAQDDWFSPVASGSAEAHAMVVCPCSMGTVAAIAHGLSDTLIERAADVAIKERRLLILVPREAPLSVIHLENMLDLARMGVVIVPASPGFYHRPETVDAVVDFIVGRVLDQLGLAHGLVPAWSSE